MALPKLIGYASKRLPPAPANYSITELELLGPYVNISQFKHLLPKVGFLLNSESFSVDLHYAK